MMGEVYRMTLTQIRYFVAVATCMNFTKAANQMYVSQQVISKQIKHLEEELGFLLFVRDKRNVMLTEGGVLLYEHWKIMLEQYDEVLVKANAIMKQEEHLLRIGTLDVSRIYDWIAHTMAMIGRIYPELQFRVDSDSYRNLFQGLISGRYDCIISLEDENTELPESFEQQVLFHFVPKLVISKNNKKYHPDMTLHELEDETLYLLSDKFSRNAEKNIRSHCKRCGFEPTKVIEFDEISSMEMSLHSGKGYTLTYELFFRNPVKELCFIDLQDDQIASATGFSVAYHKSKKDSMMQFIQGLQQTREHTF
jgi:DNA-binding transcriptional LysR family regulator